MQYFNRLTPNFPYMGRTAPQTSKRCILYIYSTNIGTEYTCFIISVFFSSKCSLFHNANLFGSCIIHILCRGCAQIKKKNNSGAKRLKSVSGYRCVTRERTDRQTGITKFVGVLLWVVVASSQEVRKCALDTSRIWIVLACTVPEQAKIFLTLR